MNSSVVFAVGAAAAAVGLWWRNANKPEACADDSDAESCDGAGYALGKRGITTNKCATPIAPYTQAIKANGMVFVSGMVGLTPDRKMVPGGVAAETRQALTNIKAALEAAGTSLDNVVKSTVLLLDIADYAAVNEVYAEFYNKKPFPARAAFAVRHLPAKAKVEIETIALCP